MLILIHLIVFGLLFYPTHKLITHINSPEFTFVNIENIPKHVQQFFFVPESYQLEINNNDSISGKIAFKILSFRFDKTFSDIDKKELYLNTLNFGDDVIGITSASNYYYSKPIDKINLREGMMIASLYEIFSNR